MKGGCFRTAWAQRRLDTSWKHLRCGGLARNSPGLILPGQVGTSDLQHRHHTKGKNPIPHAVHSSPSFPSHPLPFSGSYLGSNICSWQKPCYPNQLVALSVRPQGAPRASTNTNELPQTGLTPAAVRKQRRSFVRRPAGPAAPAGDETRRASGAD